VNAMVPVVVVGGSLNALGVVRSLARGRMPIFLVVTTPWRTAAWSRFCKVVRITSADGRSLVDALIALSTRIGEGAVLLLTEDRDVEVVSTFREELEQHFHFSFPSKEMVHTLADKTLFQKFAESEGLPVPRTIVLRNVEDLPLLQVLTPPLVIKPYAFTMLVDRGVKRAVRVDTVEQARAAATDMLEGAGRIVVQEWIEGADTDIFFTLFTCDSNSRVTAMFSGRKLTCDPPEVGITALCVAAGEREDELAELSRQFIARSGYKGIGSLEFKRDKKTGELVIIEPTVGRTDWQEEIATLCGVNIPLSTYWAELGRAAEQAPSDPLRVAWRSSMEHRPPLVGLPPGTKIIDGHFRLSDPLPGVYHYAIEQFVQRIWRLLKRVLRLRPAVSRDAGKHSTVRISKDKR
jgi:D-aspartate ligase